MELWLLWGIGVYVTFRVVAFLVDAIFRYPSRNDADLLILLTENSQGSIEWIVRSFFFWKWLKGKPCRIICLDTGSSDDTPRILKRLEQRYPGLTTRCWEHRGNLSVKEVEGRFSSQSEEKKMILDLRHPSWKWGSLSHHES
ncbi:hypothetical protein GXN76_15260 [Kroppenstedtia pulmonis]|uniref:Glycosyltransferase family 2 protein n=1 Tax=Kroppenstedtia pulmonis TaxID=1380685 RepID=A0A7D4BH92_9BACL|nr:hypothetical protein [Kroppenstedtia pulmonis]QKG85672.1 hypothetical protein GXN76_15260 [Kroppenstedtia pulmonis]